MLEVFKVDDDAADGMCGSNPLNALAERSRSYGRVLRHGWRGATNMKGALCEPDSVADWEPRICHCNSDPYAAG